MAYSLPSNGKTDDDADTSYVTESVQREHMSDLKVFWGPEICRLEYLVHLLKTGRIKGEDRSRVA